MSNCADTDPFIFMQGVDWLNQKFPKCGARPHGGGTVSLQGSMDE